MIRAMSIVFVAGCLLGVGCGDGEEGPPPTTIRESDGIRIVEHSREALDGAPVWRLGSEPVLTLGTIEGAEAFRFFRVRDAALWDGRVLVLDGGSAELRIFRTDGTHLRSVGGSGEGPGEYISPWGLLRLPGDTIAVWDRRLHRVSFLDSSGNFVRAVQIVGDLHNPDLGSVLPDGSFLVGDIRALSLPSGTMGVPVVISRYGADGLLADSLGTYSAGEITIIEERPGYVWELFGSRTGLAGDGETFWVTRGGEPQLERRSPTGDTLEIIRWEPRDREVRSEHIEAYLAERLADAASEEARRRIRRIQEVTPVAARFPAVDELLTDQTKKVWARQFRHPTDNAHHQWLVFFPDGRIAARIRVPLSFEILDAGDDYLLGVSRDEVDVEYVQLYQIEKG